MTRGVGLFRRSGRRSGILFFSLGGRGRLAVRTTGTGTDAGIDLGDQRTDLEIVVFGSHKSDLAGGLGGKFQGGLVRFEFANGLVQLHDAAVLDEPLRQGYFGDTFPDDGDFHFDDTHTKRSCLFHANVGFIKAGQQQ